MSLDQYYNAEIKTLILPNEFEEMINLPNKTKIIIFYENIPNNY